MLFGATLAPGARADQWDRKTIVTFSDSVEIPGQVLPAGTYVFKLADSPSDRHIVQIWNADETQILATTMTIPNTRSEPPDKSIFEFEERAGNSPMALKVWFIRETARDRSSSIPDLPIAGRRSLLHR